MTNKDKKPFEQIMITLQDVYGSNGKPLTELRMSFYWKSLEDLSIEEVNGAVVEISRTKTMQTFPTPAEIREAARGKIDDRAEMAFELLINTIQRVGVYRSVIFEDGLIAKCVDAMGGWDTVNDWFTKDREWHRKEFIQLYKIHEKRGIVGPTKMIGLHEAENNLRGLSEFNEEPFRIGEPEKVIPIGKMKKEVSA